MQLCRPFPRRGKLSQISVAKKLCPELVIIDGEDLTPFRDMSKKLYGVFKSFSWNQKVERLGFDEIFMDVTDIIDYNMFCLNRASLASSFFYLSKKDPEQGFVCDLTRFAGRVAGAPGEAIDFDNPLCVRLLLGSHLAYHLRMTIEDDYGFTSTCGIATNKVLSKLAGTCHKPRNQTTLLALSDDDVAAFVDSLSLARIPGIGFKTAAALERKLKPDLPPAEPHSHESRITVGEVRTHPNISPASLEILLGGSGAERGVGEKIWGLLHGADATEVKIANDVPTQISIEDTYRSLEDINQIVEELRKISKSLIRRMHVDLVAGDDNPHRQAAKRWVARPRTLRLSVNAPMGEGQTYFSRMSRSAPLPAFVFNLEDDIGQLADRLVSEAVFPLLKKFQSDKDHKWDVSLLNICVANMALAGSDDKAGLGRDISVMFKTQDEVLRPFRIESSPIESGKDGKRADSVDTDSDDEWEPSEAFETGEMCWRCGHRIPYFAVTAHERYHEFGDA